MCGSDPWNPHCARLLQAVETGFMECQGGVTSVALRSLPLPRGLFRSEHGRQPALFKTTTFHKCQRRPPAHRGLKTPRTPRRSMMSLVARCGALHLHVHEAEVSRVDTQFYRMHQIYGAQASQLWHETLASVSLSAITRPLM